MQGLARLVFGMFKVLVVAAVYVFINLAIDLLYTVLDPRVGRE